MLHVAKIDKMDTINNPGDDGLAITVWFSGCTLNCKGCHNKQLHDKNHGTPMFAEQIINNIDTSVHKSLVLLGGEPLEQPLVELSRLILEANRLGVKVWLYTGHEFDYNVLDILKPRLYAIKTGRYIESKRQDGLLASSNQKLYKKENNIFKEVTLCK